VFAKLSGLLRVFGPGWLAFRLGYALRRRIGLLRLSNPAYAWSARPLSAWLRPGLPAQPEEYARWRAANTRPFLFDRLPALPAGAPWDPQCAGAEAEELLRGRLRFFSDRLIETGFPPAWDADPSTGARLPLDRHWSAVADEGEYDIKYVWEPSRFSWAFTLVRAYAASRDERYAEAFWNALEDWMERNPPNRGPAWMDGQECALRLTAVCFAAAWLGVSAESERVARLALFAAAHAERIRANLGYALSTRSNHTVSEAFGLWLAGLLFPEFKPAAHWRDLGRRHLLAAAEQLFPDGGYAMYSLNYQRFTLHLYCLALRLGEVHDQPFPRELYDKVGAAADFLYQLVDPATGEMPEFGSNDGALVLPLNTCAFSDYRPLIQLCQYTAHRARLFPPGPWDEDLFWLYGSGPLELTPRPLPPQESSAFLDAGVYTLRALHSAAFLRCPQFRARPSHADLLHLDLRVDSTAVAVDAGTYSYHAPEPWRNPLSAAAYHNTVTVDGRDPLTRLGRFTWGEWPAARVLRREPGLWLGEQDGYLRLSDPVRQRRAVLVLAGERWLVLDLLRGLRPHRFRLHWLLADLPHQPLERGLLVTLPDRPLLVQLGSLQEQGEYSLVRADPDSPRGWRSRTYGQREPALSLSLELTAPAAAFWTLFGQPGDRVESAPAGLILHTADGPIPVDISSFETI
jgi:asparagine synthase (glutamine-hydrolysing)